MNKVQKLALLYMLLLAVFLYGYAAARFELPPHGLFEPRIKEFEAFAAGAGLEKDSSVLDKLKNDAGLSPLRFTYGPPDGLYDWHEPLPMTGLRSRREQPQVYISDDHPSGYRFIAGAMDFEETFWGALLISPEGEVVNTWKLTTEHLPGNKEGDLLKILYGLHIGPDASVTFLMQESGGGIVKVDACGNEVWNLPGLYHHTVSSNGEGAFWAFEGSQYTLDQDMVKVSEETGEILQRIDMTEVRKANRYLHIWDLSMPLLGTVEQRYKIGNLTHGNDIDALRPDVAASFPQFEVGDLLISYATTNLVFVLDPDTLEVKWWRIGLVDYQHDPDWESDGRITIFSNERRWEDNKSRIVWVDPKTYESGDTFNGEANGFRSPANGMHQRTEFGSRMVTSANQGWVFEVDDAGETVFSFLNTYSQADNRTLFLADSYHLPANYFTGKPWEQCAPADLER